jgi:signal transduction histidine kinase
MMRDIVSVQTELGGSAIAADDLLDQIQSWAERDKANLARELHDELGGLLVGAVMDIAWVEQHLEPVLDSQSRQKFGRVKQCLSAAIDMKRTMIEKLRPSLLDNFGLFAALRWLMKNACRKAGLSCTQSYPPDEPHFKPSASIAVYRVVQDALGIVLANEACSAVDLGVTSDGETIHFQVTGAGADWDARLDEDRESYVLASMQQRARSLGGEIAIARAPDSRTLALTASIPLENALAAGDSGSV